MKNYKIIAAWNTVDPDGSADARMLSAILRAHSSSQNRKSIRYAKIKKNIILVAACLTLLAIVSIVGFHRSRIEGNKELLEQESEASGAVIHEGAPVNDTEVKLTVPFVNEEIDAAFGHLFPTEIAEGYILSEEGIELYSDSPDALHAEYRTLKAVYDIKEMDDTLLIEVSPSGFLSNVAYGTVLYGDPQIDGTRSSMIYYENEGITILYRFAKTDIAAMDTASAKRFYAMIRSANCFAFNSADPGDEGNDEPVDRIP